MSYTKVLDKGYVCERCPSASVGATWEDDEDPNYWYLCEDCHNELHGTTPGERTTAMGYKGYDYTELFPVLGVECFDRELGEDMSVFKEALARLIHDDDPGDKVAHIRAYVYAMSGSDPGYWGPIWRGMVLCQEDRTFVQACHSLAEHMWT